MALLTVLTKDTNLFSCLTLILYFMKWKIATNPSNFLHTRNSCNYKIQTILFDSDLFQNVIFVRTQCDSCLVGNANIHFNQSNNLNYFDVMLLIQLFSSFWIIPFIMWRRQWMMISLWHSQSVMIKPRKWQWLTRRWNMRMWWTI